MTSFTILVDSLPTDYETSFYGARAVPSLSGTGAYVQHEDRFYELICTSSACSWSIMNIQLLNSVSEAVMMYLPSDYTC